MNDKIKDVLLRAVEVVLWRGTDVHIVDGCYATTDLDTIIRLEAEIVEAFDLPSDDVNEDNLSILHAMINEL